MHLSFIGVIKQRWKWLLELRFGPSGGGRLSGCQDHLKSKQKFQAGLKVEPQSFSDPRTRLLGWRLQYKDILMIVYCVAVVLWWVCWGVYWNVVFLKDSPDFFLILQLSWLAIWRICHTWGCLRTCHQAITRARWMDYLSAVRDCLCSKLTFGCFIFWLVSRFRLSLTLTSSSRFCSGPDTESAGSRATPLRAAPLLGSSVPSDFYCGFFCLLGLR